MNLRNKILIISFFLSVVFLVATLLCATLEGVYEENYIYLETLTFYGASTVISLFLWFGTGAIFWITFFLYFPEEKKERKERERLVYERIEKEPR